MASIGTTTRPTVSIDGREPIPCEVQITQDYIDVSSATATKRDPDWSFVDSNGHFHAWADSDVNDLPTLRVEQIPCDGACGDPDDTISLYLCKICGEEVEPRTEPDYAARNGARIPGQRSVTITVHNERLAPETRLSMLVRMGDKEYFGIGKVVNVERQSLGGQIEERLTLAGEFLEPRLTA